MDVICQPGYCGMRLVQIFGHSEYVGSEGAIDSLRDDGDARIESSDVTIWVEAKYFDDTVRHRNT